MYVPDVMVQYAANNIAHMPYLIHRCVATGVNSETDYRGYAPNGERTTMLRVKYLTRNNVAGQIFDPQHFNGEIIVK